MASWFQKSLERCLGVAVKVEVYGSSVGHLLGGPPPTDCDLEFLLPCYSKSLHETVKTTIQEQTLELFKYHVHNQKPDLPVASALLKNIYPVSFKTIPGHRGFQYRMGTLELSFKYACTRPVGLAPWNGFRLRLENGTVYCYQGTKPIKQKKKFILALDQLWRRRCPISNPSEVNHLFFRLLHLINQGAQLQPADFQIALEKLHAYTSKELSTQYEKHLQNHGVASLQQRVDLLNTLTCLRSNSLLCTQALPGWLKNRFEKEEKAFGLLFAQNPEWIPTLLDFIYGAALYSFLQQSAQGEPLYAWELPFSPAQARPFFGIKTAELECFLAMRTPGKSASPFEIAAGFFNSWLRLQQPGAPSLNALSPLFEEIGFPMKDFQTTSYQKVVTRFFKNWHKRKLLLAQKELGLSWAESQLKTLPVLELEKRRLSLRQHGERLKPLEQTEQLAFIRQLLSLPPQTCTPEQLTALNRHLKKLVKLPTDSPFLKETLQKSVRFLLALMKFGPQPDLLAPLNQYQRLSLLNWESSLHSPSVSAFGFRNPAVFSIVFKAFLKSRPITVLYSLQDQLKGTKEEQLAAARRCVRSWSRVKLKLGNSEQQQLKAGARIIAILSASGDLNDLDAAFKHYRSKRTNTLSQSALAILKGLMKQPTISKGFLEHIPNLIADLPAQEASLRIKLSIKLAKVPSIASIKVAQDVVLNFFQKENSFSSAHEKLFADCLNGLLLAMIKIKDWESASMFESQGIACFDKAHHPLFLKEVAHTVKSAFFEEVNLDVVAHPPHSRTQTTLDNLTQALPLLAKFCRSEIKENLSGLIKLKLLQKSIATAPKLSIEDVLSLSAFLIETDKHDLFDLGTRGELGLLMAGHLCCEEGHFAPQASQHITALYRLKAITPIIQNELRRLLVCINLGFIRCLLTTPLKAPEYTAQFLSHLSTCWKPFLTKPIHKDHDRLCNDAEALMKMLTLLPYCFSVVYELKKKGVTDDTESLFEIFKKSDYFNIPEICDYSPADIKLVFILAAAEKLSVGQLQEASSHNAFKRLLDPLWIAAEVSFTLSAEWLERRINKYGKGEKIVVDAQRTTWLLFFKYRESFIEHHVKGSDSTIQFKKMTILKTLMESKFASLYKLLAQKGAYLLEKKALFYLK